MWVRWSAEVSFFAAECAHRQVAAAFAIVFNERGLLFGVLLLMLVVVPIAASAARYLWLGDGRGNWQTADRSSVGLLPPAAANPDAMVRVFAARTVRWRSIFAVHTWIVVKEKGAASYSRYDYTAWGDPIRTNGFAPDGRWFGAVPETIVALIQLFLQST